MSKTVKRIIAAVLLGAMVLSTVGCGGKNKNDNAIDKNTIFIEKELDIPFPEGSYINAVSVGKERVFFVGYSYNEQSYYSQYFIGTCNTDGSDYSITELKDDKGNAGQYIDGIYATSDNKAIITYTEYYEDNTDPDNYIWENYFYIAKVDERGNVIDKFDVSTYNISYVNSLTLLKDNSFVMYANDSLYRFDSDCNLIAQKEIGNAIYLNTFFTLKDGSLCANYWSDEGKEVIKKLDINSLELGDEVKNPVSLDNYGIMSGTDEYDVLFRTSGSIYGYNFGDAETKEIFNLINSDVNTSYFNSFSVLPDGSYIGTYTEYTDNTNKTVVAKYTKLDPKDYVEKTVLTLGCVYIDTEIRSQVVAFNKKSDKYRIAIKDYSIYNTDDNYSAGNDKFNSDVASGQAPDIIIADDPSFVGNLASKGLFANLYDFLDKDSTVDKNDIWPNLLKSCETDGKLYEIVPSFYIQTLAGKKSVLGDRTGWTMDEMIAFEKNLPEGTALLQRMSREAFLSMMLYSLGNDYVDMKNATCNFNSDSFKAILTYSAGLPAESEMDYDDEFYSEYNSQWRENKVVLYNWYCANADSYQEIIRGYLGEDISIVGYPTADGSNGSLIWYYSSVAISSKCKNQEGAWEFVKTFLSKEYQSGQTWGIPASMSQFAENAKSTMTRPSYTNYDGTVEYYDNTWWIGDTSIVMDPLTQAEVDNLTNFIKSVDKKASSVDSSIIEIIDDEAASFFSGQKNVDDVVNIIQNRVSTYIKEKQ